jgi:predicted regulator of amino acid metabolism with ACT domain
MQLVFDEYFKAYPVKKKIVERLYANGISIVNDKFFVNNIEVPLSSIANAIKVNRRTLYETIKFVNNNPVVKDIMENISVLPDIKKVSLLMANEIVTIYIDKGMYSKVILKIFNITGKYASNIKEIYSINSDYEINFIRIIFYNNVEKSIFQMFNGISGINKIVIDSPEKINVICDKCEIKICPHKISSSFREHNIYKQI